MLRALVHTGLHGPAFRASDGRAVPARCQRDSDERGVDSIFSPLIPAQITTQVLRLARLSVRIFDPPVQRRVGYAVLAV
jgi:hypothetical protein